MSFKFLSAYMYLLANIIPPQIQMNSSKQNFEKHELSLKKLKKPYCTVYGYAVHNYYIHYYDRNIIYD